MDWVRQRLTYANIVASLALFLALGGGAYAMVGNPFVGRKGVIKMCVQRADHVPIVVKPRHACPAGTTPLRVSQKGRRGRRGPKGRPGSTQPPAFIDLYMGLEEISIPPGGRFRFVDATGQAGITDQTGDVTLEDDNATIHVGTPGTYLVTVAVGPAGPVQLEVDGTRIQPNEATCTGASVCTFQRILSLASPSEIALVNTSPDAEQEQVGSGVTILRIA